MKRFALLFLFLMACQSDKAPPASERQDPGTPPVVPQVTSAPVASRDPLLEALEKAEVVCEDNKKCFSDNAVLVIVLRDSGAIEKCSGFLVNETTVATSSDCLGDVAPDCTKRVGIKFPKTYPGERKIRLCAEVVPGDKKEGALLTGLDFAFFKVQP